MARQRSLHLISLSNYVFVLEISQISGIVPNVSMLIRVVMRVCSGRRKVNVGLGRRWGRGEEVDGGMCHCRNRKHLVGLNPLYQSRGAVARKIFPKKQKVLLLPQSTLPMPLARGVGLDWRCGGCVLLLFTSGQKKVRFDPPLHLQTLCVPASRTEASHTEPLFDSLSCFAWCSRIAAAPPTPQSPLRLPLLPLPTAPASHSISPHPHTSCSDHQVRTSSVVSVPQPLLPLLLSSVLSPPLLHSQPNSPTNLPSPIHTRVHTRSHALAHTHTSAPPAPQ